MRLFFGQSRQWHVSIRNQLKPAFIGLMENLGSNQYGSLSAL